MGCALHVRRLITGQSLRLDPSFRLAEGGEGTVWSIDEPEPVCGRLVAKTYHRPDSQRARKLAAMIAHPPARSESLAWPVDLLCSEAEGRAVVGYVMRRIEAARPLADVHNPAGRRRCFPHFSSVHLIRVARNLAAVAADLHEQGYVIGDLSESNVLVGEDARVTLVDTDSFQVRDPIRGVAFRCRVGRPEFTPPELIAHPSAHAVRQTEQDLFALAVLLFRLLMEGTHPFAQTCSDRGEAPSISDRIAAGRFPYVHPIGASSPVPGAPPFSNLSPRLRAHFVACFRDGHQAPQARPSARAWQAILEAEEKELVPCRTNVRHAYGGHLAQCPWCVRATWLGGRDPFAARVPPRAAGDPWEALGATMLEAVGSLAGSCEAISAALIAALALTQTDRRARLLLALARIPRRLHQTAGALPAGRLVVHVRRWGRRLRRAPLRPALCRAGSGF